MINYIQRDGRRTKFVTKSNIYYKNMAINEIRKVFPNYFIVSAKGTLLNMKNVKEIDWKKMLVNFKDGSSNYVVTNSHKKEIEKYQII
jgi:DNA-binding LytR/AlgR family response regulator